MLATSIALRLARRLAHRASGLAYGDAVGCHRRRSLHPFFYSARARRADRYRPRAPYCKDRIQPPVMPSAGNAITLSHATLRKAAVTRIFWVLAGTLFICGLSTTSGYQPAFIPFCTDNSVGTVAAASFLAMIGASNFTGIICSGWLSDHFDNRMVLACYYGFRGLSPACCAMPIPPTCPPISPKILSA